MLAFYLINQFQVYDRLLRSLSHIHPSRKKKEGHLRLAILIVWCLKAMISRPDDKSQIRELTKDRLGILTAITHYNRPYIREEAINIVTLSLIVTSSMGAPVELKVDSSNIRQNKQGGAPYKKSIAPVNRRDNSNNDDDLLITHSSLKKPILRIGLPSGAHGICKQLIC